jgi:chitodextrinase
MPKRFTKNFLLRFITLTNLGIASLCLTVATLAAPASAATTCQTPNPSYGSVTSGVSVPATATYRIWSRMMAGSATDNTYYLNVDGTSCFNVGGTGVSASDWSWIDYQNGSASSTVDLALTQGSHTLTLIGNAPNVALDHIVLTSDLNCVPTGNGDNCNTPSDTTPPTVQITAPVGGSTVSGTTQIQAGASDNVGVTKVELYDNSILESTLTSAPYNFSLDTTKLGNGSQTLIAKAYDAAGNFASASVSVIVQNSDTQAPTAPGNFVVTAPSYNKAMLGWQASTDNVGVKGYNITRNGAPLIDLGNVTSYEDDTVLPNTKYTYQITAIDTSGNLSAPVTATVTTPNVTDTQAPTAPSNLTAQAVSSSQINLSWQASTDNTGVASYDVYRGANGNTPHKIISVSTTSYGDTNLNANTKYTYYVIARDVAGNQSPKSAKVSATTQKLQRQGVVQGTVRDARTNKAIANATVVISGQGGRTFYRTDARGQYVIRKLRSTRYSVSYRAPGYDSKSVTIRVTAEGVVTKNVQLRKQ